jgi:CO/xanthine dehydrogenase FAD-binding subunit
MAPNSASPGRRASAASARPNSSPAHSARHGATTSCWPRSRCRLPARRGARHGFRKLKHSEGSWPILTASCLATRGGLRVALGGLAPVPVAAEGAADTDFTAALTAQVSEPWQDELADANYRRFAAPALVARVVAAAAGELS